MKDINLYDRVSSVLYPFSGLNKIDPKVLEFAACRGSVCHLLIDSLIGGFGKYTLDSLVEDYCEDLRPGDGIEELIEKEREKVRLMIQSFEKWVEGRVFLPKPERFFCDDLMITGECDQVTHDGVLIDFKTSYNESPSWILQGSAYSYMAKKAYYPIENIEFVQLSKTGGKPRIYTYDENFPLFRAHLDVFRYSYKGAKDIDVLDFL